MQPLSGERLLLAHDRGHAEHALLRAITLLEMVLPGSDRAQLLGLPIAVRDRLLLQLRQMSFGSTLGGYASCPQCDAAMEFSLAVATALDGLDEVRAPASLKWIENGDEMHLRQVTSDDLLAALAMRDDALAERCLLARSLGFDDVCDEAVARMSLPSVQAHFEQLHAATELRCALCCPQCGGEDSWSLDVGHFVCLEARHAAQRLLADIHTLALQNGWSESAIATMSSPRRNAYLELLGA
jgi:hypothetical protein